MRTCMNLGGASLEARPDVRGAPRGWQVLGDLPRTCHACQPEPGFPLPISLGPERALALQLVAPVDIAIGICLCWW
jgi:hypothetical protein